MRIRFGYQSVLSLSDQLELFREFKIKLKAAVGERSLEMMISKSIFLVCSGANDIANTYFLGPFRRPHYDIQAYTDLMANSASDFLQVCFTKQIAYIYTVILLKEANMLN